MSVIKSLKKSNIFLIAIILFLIAIISILLINNNTDKVIISSGNSHKENINTSNALTMMYETEAGSGEYQVSSDTTWPQDGYVFNETLSKCENGGILTWDDENKKVLLQTNTSDKCYVYFDKEPDVIYLADYIKNTVYQGDGVNGLYYHDGQGTYTNADQEAGDNSYRYAGTNPDNYVCFGDDCSDENNLYRIIGVFGSEEKLIKNTNIGNYAWDSGGSNTWNSSTKPDIRNTLNITFLNTLNITWQNKIATHTYKVGGMDYGYSTTAKQYYDTEVGSSSSSTTDSMKIGLMYVSDYGYAANPSSWTTSLTNYRNNDWLKSSSTEFFISPRSDTSNIAFYQTGGGVVAVITNCVIELWAVRPSFYLNSDVQYISGSGTQSDPFRIA